MNNEPHIPLISIIIPVYNAEKYIETCLSSILEQTVKNSEVICVNDGSVDNSENILKLLSKQDMRIKVINTKNYGVSSARNRGLELSRGKYITFVDSDDYIDQNMYSTMISAMENENTNLAACAIQDIGKTTELRSLENISSKFDFINEGILLASVTNKIFKKSIIESHNLRFSENAHIGEDLDFAFRYLLAADRITFVNKPFYKYVKHGTNSVTDKNKRITIFYSLKNSSDYIKNNIDSSHKDYETVKSVFNRLFRLHALEFGYRDLIKTADNKAVNEIRNLTDDMILDDKSIRLLNKMLFFVRHKYFYNIFKILKLRIVTL